MEKRRLGRTGLMVSVVGFGGIPIQRVSDDEAIGLLDLARENGMNFIDSARGYTISEERIGRAIADCRDEWIIASKSTVRTYDGMKAEVEVSLSNFQTNCLELYQLHFVKDMADYENAMSENGAYRALVEAKQEGKIKHIGITSHSVDVLTAVVKKDAEKFDTIQFPYNIIERQGEALFELAKQEDIGVILMKPIGGGAIENGGLSLKFVLNNSNVTSAIPGMQTLEEVEINAGVAHESLLLSQHELDEIETIKNKLGTKFCRRCGYCLPCVEGINIPSVFVLEGYLTRYNLKEWAVDRYFSMAKAASDCSGCGVCETKCPYELPIREMMKSAAENFGAYGE